MWNFLFWIHVSQASPWTIGSGSRAASRDGDSKHLPLDPTFDHSPHKNILFLSGISCIWVPISWGSGLGGSGPCPISTDRDSLSLDILIQHLTIVPIIYFIFKRNFLYLGPYQPGFTLAMELDAKIPLYGMPQFPGWFSLKPQPHKAFRGAAAGIRNRNLGAPTLFILEF